MSEAADRERKRREAASYDAVAGEFDRFSEQLSGPLADRLVALGHVGAGDSVLDVGTGTGLVAFRAAAAAPAGTVLGVDLSEGMLAVAADRARDRGLAERAAFRRMDAEALELPEGSFDVVLSLFALRHLPDPRRALGQFARVLRPGGRLVVGVGSGPPLFSAEGLRRAAGSVWDGVEAACGRLIIGPPALVRLVSAQLAVPAAGRLPAPLARLVAEAGFRGVSVHWQGGRAELKDPAVFWRMLTTYMTGVRKALAGAAPEQVEAIRAGFEGRCERVLGCGGRLVYPYGALMVAGRRPHVE